jgi:hypothetical protein
MESKCEKVADLGFCKRGRNTTSWGPTEVNRAPARVLCMTMTAKKKNRRQQLLSISFFAGFVHHLSKPSFMLMPEILRSRLSGCSGCPLI